MIGKRELLANFLSVTGLNLVIAKLRSLFVNDVRIIAYHRICETDALNDQELVSATCDEFEKQIIHIKKNYSAISFEQLINHLNNDTTPPRNAVIITFDDGFADNYLNAFPILEKYQIPATIFISTDYIDTDKTFWFNLLSRLVKLNVGASFSLDDKRYAVSSKPENQESLLVELLSLMKGKPNKNRLELLIELSKQLPESELCDNYALPMTWDNVREMDKSVIEFGSHTATHPILSQLTHEELEYEIVGSKKQLEKQLGKKIQTISYPEGMEYAYNNKVIEMVTNSGYELGCSYIPGVNKLGSLDSFQLKRMHIERYVKFSLFRSMLALPEVFA
jgi:peptidoglycan/xylan/chitin deacetylase (PgdA/CDA1 family)